MGVVVERFDVFLVTLDPTEGVEIQKTRPCLVIIAPMSTRTRDYPSRVACAFQGKDGQIVLDQIRAVDKGRLVRRLGRIDEPTQGKVLPVLAEMFAR